MKIKPEHYAHMEQQINKLLDASPLEAVIEYYEHGKFPGAEFPRADGVTDLQTRFCHDLLDAAGLIPYVCDNIYTYASEDDLLTALKRICPQVVRKY